MAQRISNFTFKSALFCLLLLCAWNSNLSAQQAQQKPPAKENNEAKDDEIVYFPLYNGISVSLDLFGLGAGVLGSDFLSTEIGVEVDLKNRYMPVLEVGYGSTDTWSDTGIHYKSSAPYFRIGMNYNTMYKKGNPNYLYVGFRYGFSSFKYDVGNVPVTDDIYGGGMDNPAMQDNIWGGSVPYYKEGVKASMGWLEALVGVRAHIYKNIYMGWTVRMRYRKNCSFDENSDPWYIPGYGKYDTPKLGMTYTLIYKLP